MPEIAPATVLPSPTSKVPWHRRASAWLWGYDYFISYHWASGGTYAEKLAKRLRDRGYDVFLDRAEYAMGDDWKEIGERALRNTKRLVLVATREAVTLSKPVEHEVKVFTGRKRQVIPVVFFASSDEGERSTIADLNRSEHLVLGLISESHLYVQEKLANLSIGPADDVVERLTHTYWVMRGRNIRAMLVLVVVLIVVALIASALGSYANALSEAETARWERDNAQKATKRESDERQKAVVAEKVAVGAKTDALRELSNTQWQSGCSARDLLSDPLLARHHFLRATRAATSANDPGAARRSLWAAAALPGGNTTAVVHDGPVNGARLSNTGRLLTWSGGTAYVWDIHNQSLIARLPHPARDEHRPQAIQGARFLGQKNDRILTWNDDGTAFIWCGERLDQKVSLSDGDFERVAFSAGENLALTWKKSRGEGGRGFVRGPSVAKLWDLREGRQVARFAHEPLGTGYQIEGATLSGDGSRVMTWDGGGRVSLWRPDTSQRVGHFANESIKRGDSTLSNETSGALFAHDSSFAVSWGPLSAYIYDLSTWASAEPKRSAWYPAEFRWVHSVTVTKDKVLAWTTPAPTEFGAVATGSELWELPRPPKSGRNEPLTRLDIKGLKGVVWDGTGKRAVSWEWNSSRATLREVLPETEYDAISKSLVRRRSPGAVIDWIDHGSPVAGAVWSSSGQRLFTWGERSTGFVWKVGPADVQRQRLTHDRAISDAYFASDDQLVTAGADGVSRVWDLRAQPEIGPFDTEPDPLVRVNREINQAEFSIEHPDNVLGAVVLGGDLAAWTGRVVCRWRLSSGPTHKPVVSTGLAYRAELERIRSVVPPPVGSPSAAGGTVTLACKGHVVQVRDVATQAVLANLIHTLPRGEEDFVRGAVFHPKTSRVVTRSLANLVRVWDWSTPAAPVAVFGDGGPVLGYSLTGEGDCILTWGDTRAVLWDIRREQPIARFSHNTPIVGASLNSADRYVLTWGKDGLVRVWSIGLDDTPIDERIRALEIRSASTIDESGRFRPLTHPEWRGGPPPRK